MENYENGVSHGRAKSRVKVFRVNSVDDIVYVFDDDATNAESYLKRTQHWYEGYKPTPRKRQDVENVPFRFLSLHSTTVARIGFPLYNG